MFEIVLDKEADCVTVYLAESDQHVSIETMKAEANNILQDIQKYEYEKGAK